MIDIIANFTSCSKGRGARLLIILTCFLCQFDAYSGVVMPRSLSGLQCLWMCVTWLQVCLKCADLGHLSAAIDVHLK